MRKHIYSLPDLQKLLRAANQRYLEFISTFTDRTVGLKNLNKVSKSIEDNGRRYKGFNFFLDEDLTILRTIARGEFNISGFQNKNLKQLLWQKTSSQISRVLKRLRTHNLIKRIGRTYKYYLSKLGRIVVATGLKLRELYLIPQLCF